MFKISSIKVDLKVYFQVTSPITLGFKRYFTNVITNNNEFYN